MPPLDFPLKDFQHAVTSLRRSDVVVWPQRKNWREAGLRAVVLTEGPAAGPDHTAVEICPWQRPVHWHGRSLAAVAECLELSDQRNSHQGALVLNADLYLGPGFAEALREIRKAESIALFTRQEIQHWPHTHGARANEHGWDGVWLPHRHLHHFRNPAFALGLPWWDYWIPYKALRLGLPVTVVTRPVCFHETHPEVWQEREQEALCAAVWKDLGYGPVRRKLHHLFAPKAERKIYGYWNHLSGEIRRRVRAEARFLDA